MNTLKAGADLGNWWRRLRLERAASRELSRVLTAQLREILRRLRAGQSIAEIMTILGDTPELRSVLQRALFNAADWGVQSAEAALGIGIDWTLVNIAAREWASQYAYQLVTDINETSRRVLQKFIGQWIENGEPLSRLVADLQPYFGKRRADLIATTETTRAYAEANQLAFQQAGIQKRRWNTARDELVCPICGPLNGAVVGINEPFGTGISLPPSHPNCRCWITPVVEQ